MKLSTGFKILTFFLLGLFWYNAVCRIHPKDRENYLLESPSEKPLNALQIREGVSKDLYIVKQDRSRLHYKIESASSICKLASHDRKIEITEELNAIQCWAQEKIYLSAHDAMQQVHYFEAQKGVYDFNTQRFSAPDVFLSLFRQTGEDIIKTTENRTLLMEGVAQNVSFSMASKDPSLQTTHFKANLSPSIYSKGEK
jgi:hypothetical protein